MLIVHFQVNEVVEWGDVHFVKGKKCIEAPTYRKDLRITLRCSAEGIEEHSGTPFRPFIQGIDVGSLTVACSSVCR